MSYFEHKLIRTMFGKLFRKKPDEGFPPEVSVEDLKETAILLHPEQKIDLSKNQIFCSTICLTWKKLKDQFEGSVLISNTFEELKLLDYASGHRTLPEEDVDILVEKIGMECRVEVNYEAALSFKKQFKSFNDKLLFNDVAVKSFGCFEFNPKLEKQVEVLYYHSSTDFAFRLIPRNKKHEIRLFRDDSISQAETLSDIRNHFRSKVANRPEKFDCKFDSDSESLNVPEIRFNLKRIFDEIIGAGFSAGGMDQVIADAWQSTGLVLDHTGAFVRSRAAIASFGFVDQPRRLILNRPFFLEMKMRDAKEPYLLVWVANPEVLQKTGGHLPQG